MAAAAQALSRDTRTESGGTSTMHVLSASHGLRPTPREATPGRLPRLERGSLAARLLTIAFLVAAVVSLLLAVPGLQTVASEIRHLSGGWLALAVALELASCASFVVVFRHFFTGVPAQGARELAWTEMGSGALLPGGGVGSLAVGGWLLHLAGMPTRKIVRNSSGLFFLTSAVNVATLIAGGLLLASGVSAGRHDLLRAGLPILAGSLVFATVLAATRLGRRGSPALAGSSWAAQLLGGIGAAEGAVSHPSWRLVGAIGYLGFDIAVLWATLSAVGYSPPLAVLILGYIIGYLANLIPVPGAVGVLEGGIAGTLILYGAPAAEATAGVLVYHAIAFWIPSIGGLFGYRRLRRHLSTDIDLTPADDQGIPARATTTAAVLAATASEAELERSTEPSASPLSRRGARPTPTVTSPWRTHAEPYDSQPPACCARTHGGGRAVALEGPPDGVAPAPPRGARGRVATVAAGLGAHASIERGPRGTR
jgi:uncharacterized membrane protein YbhN (UPF0104 family)